MISGIRIKEKNNSKDFVWFAHKIARGIEIKHNLLTANSAEDLKVVFHNRIEHARPVYEKSQNEFGRFINWLHREQPNGDVEINSFELLAILNAINETTDINILGGSTYWLPFRTAEDMLKRLKKWSEPLAN